jgi:PAS domain S-box-containing protein
MTGFEVLARWPHPELGFVLPQNFISLAEESGLIGELMQQILHSAFLSAQDLPKPLALAVNVSPIQLQNLNLPDQIRNAAEKSGFPLDRLIIEVTENALAKDLEMAQKIARSLKAMGCKLALDDFGTGYSSLRHLQALPFDALKVDKSFVDSMTETRESRKIVAAIIGLGHSLGLITVAEGVETEEQADMLICLGCELAQGWLYGRAVPADRICDVVAAASQNLPVRPSTSNDRSGMTSSLEAQPAQRLAQLQAIYDGAPVGLCFLDCNLRYVSINRRLADIEGSSVSSHLGRTVKEVIPEIYPAVEPYLIRALRGESIQEVEVSWPAGKSGEPVRTDLLSYQPALDEAGEVIGVSVAVVDITERKRGEEALRDSEGHRQHVADLNPETPWVMDAEGNSLDISSRWVQTTGLNKEQARTLGWMDALYPADVKPTMKALREALKVGTPIDVEYRVEGDDGELRWKRSRGSPRFGASGEILRWYGSVEDIDERKRMVEDLRKSLP